MQRNQPNTSQTTMGKYYYKLLLALLTYISANLSWNDAKAACPNFSPNFTLTQNRSCGVPVIIKLKNTTTGTSKNVAGYVWKLGSTILKSGTGLDSLTYTITAPGTYTFKLIVTDTGKLKCKDSISKSVTITSVIPRAKDASGNFSYAPLWENCISQSGVPDTFGVTLQMEDSLKNYKVFWGDGSSNTGTLLLKTASIYHKYTTLGQFQVMITTAIGTCNDTIFGLVINERQPVAGLIGPPTGTNQGCVPLMVRFINNSLKSSPSTTFKWDMGDGKIYTLGSNTNKDTLYHTYKRFICGGIVTLTAQNNCGNSSATWNPIQASSKDSGILTWDNPSNCNLSVPMEFSNNSQNRFCGSPNPKKYKWIWGDGTNSGWMTAKSPQTKLYTKRGTYNMMLIDSNSCGKDTFKYTLRIDSLPKAIATGTPISGCAPLTVNFSDQSIGNVTARNWNFNDPYSSNNFASVANASHTYSTGGNYKAILTISNSCGSVKDTVDVFVKQKVKAGITPFFNGCTPFVCSPKNNSTIAYTSGTQWKWILPNSTTSTLKDPNSFTINSSGTYTITLIATDSCGSDTTTKTFTVYNKTSPTITITSSGNCAKTPITFNRISTVTGTLYWDFKDGGGYQTLFTNQNINYSYSRTLDTAKTYNTYFIWEDVNQCRDTQIYPVTVHPYPTAQFSVDNSNGCGPLPVKFTNSSVPKIGTFAQMKFDWKFTPTSAISNAVDSTIIFPKHPNKDTFYQIKLLAINSQGCKDSAYRTIQVYPKPISKFLLNNNSGCAPLKINTFNQSDPNDTGSIYIMKFNWDFANGSKSKKTDTSATFYASKTKDTFYNIMLEAISEHGCKDTSYKSVQVFPKPLSSFNINNSAGCKPLNVAFTNNSTPYDTGSINIMTFRWNFGDKGTSNVKSPGNQYTEKYNFDTIYRVSLIATSEHGCIDTSYRNVTLHPDPDIRYSPDIAGGCGPLTVKFTNNTINAVNYSWKFGDYGTSNAQNVTKVFYGRPIFDSFVYVQLSATSLYGCKSDTVTQRITVYGNPVANYFVSKDTFCFPDKMQFFNQSLASYSYKWNFGDGTVLNTTNPSHFFRKNPDPFHDTTYYIYLVATSPNTCKDTFKGSMTVLPYPVPNFTIDKTEGCSPLTVSFKNTSINSLDYKWEMGDGYVMNSLKDVVHKYVNTGLNDTLFRAVLWTYSIDCIDSASVVIPVYRPSYSFFRADRVNSCDKGFFQFKDGTENAPNLLWKFGDGTTSNTRSPLHLFPTSPFQDTSYTVKLYAYSARNCTDSFSRVITLPQRLQMGIKDTGYSVCLPYSVKFYNYTKGAKTYIWDFGDNSGSASKEPVHEYSKPGIFYYKLYAFDPLGCMDSAIASNFIKVAESPTADFKFGPAKPRMPSQNRVYFYNQSKSTLPMTYKWDFADPAGTPPTSTIFEPFHDYSDSGNFNVQLVVSNGGCQDTAWLIIRVEPPYPKPNFSVDRDSGCPQHTVQFTNQTQNADKFLWFFGDGGRSEDKDPIHVYKYSGYYDVTLVAKGPGGETDTIKKQFIKVLNKPFTFFLTAPDNLYLPRAIFNTRNQTSGAVGYQWNVYNSASKARVGNSIQVNPYFQVTDTGHYDVELISRSPQNCYDTLLLPRAVYVNPTGILHVPDAFTPTKDDRNEVFKPEALNMQKDFYLFKIFNRWGETVFETTDPDKGWDGYFSGKLCQSGVYVFKINGRLFNGDDIERQGVVHLLR